MNDKAFENLLTNSISKKITPSNELIEKTIEQINIQQDKENKSVWILSGFSILLFWLESILLFYYNGYSLFTVVLYVLLSSSFNLVIGYIFFKKKSFNFIRRGEFE